MDVHNESTAAETRNLYAKREKIHAREIGGLYAKLRNAFTVSLLGLYYFLPWIPWNGRQAVLFDLPARKFFIFGITMWPQDFFYLSWLLIMAALLLFLTTAVAGRLWCGYACPQTVWTKAFVWLEHIAEGNFLRRRKLDQSPWTRSKFLRKSFRQFLWLSFALWTGFTFVGYFVPIQDLGARLMRFDVGGWELFWILFYGLATYGNAGSLREQVCKYMCPYARFQSAMFDKDTLIVSYDPRRGDPKGSRQRGINPADVGLGDCIDCSICVQVCPTGIDIRDGLQYECIACAACVDACDSVMDRMGYEPGLIRYTTQNILEGGETKVFRARPVIYALLLGLSFVAFCISIINREPLHLDVIRDRNALYRQVAGNEVENVYTLKVLNKDEQPRMLSFSVTGLPGISIETDPRQLQLNGGEVRGVAARVRVPREGLRAGGHDIVITTVATGDQALTAERRARFIAPLE